MKRITLLMAVMLFSLGTHAQFHVTSNMGDIHDGDTLTYGSVAANEASVEFVVHNDTTISIDTHIKVISINNTSGSMAELCYGQCYNLIAEGETIPHSSYQGGIVTIPANSQSALGNHFWNQDSTGDTPGEPIVYVLEFQQMDISGMFPSKTLRFTYIYDADMSIENHKKDMNVQIMSTIIKDGELGVKTQEPVDFQIYNLLGQQIMSEKLDGGVNTINVSNLSSQVYLVRFHNAQGQTKTQKIIIK